MEMEDANNGYFLHGDDVILIDFAKSQECYRFLRRDALIVPTGAGAVCTLDRSPSENFLSDVAKTGTADKARIRAFIEPNLKFTSPEIRKHL